MGWLALLESLMLQKLGSQIHFCIMYLQASRREELQPTVTTSHEWSCAIVLEDAQGMMFHRERKIPQLEP
jgi:hypothetical protein